MIKVAEIKGTPRVELFIVSMNDGTAYYQKDRLATPNRNEAKVFTNFKAANRVAKRKAGTLSRVERL